MITGRKYRKFRIHDMIQIDSENKKHGFFRRLHILTVKKRKILRITLQKLLKSQCLNSLIFLNHCKKLIMICSTRVHRVTDYSMVPLLFQVLRHRFYRIVMNHNEWSIFFVCSTGFAHLVTNITKLCLGKLSNVNSATVCLSLFVCLCLCVRTSVWTSDCEWGSGFVHVCVCVCVCVCVSISVF